MPLTVVAAHPPRAIVANEPSVRVRHTAGPLGQRLGLGGIGWRAGVPHIIIYAGDATGAAAFPVTQDLGYYYDDTLGDYRVPLGIDESWWPTSTYVQPLSARASGAVHINAFKQHQQRYNSSLVWSWNAELERWDFTGPAGTDVLGFERFGHTGDYWLGDPEHPEVIATVPQALEALAALDINVMCLQGSTYEWPGLDFDYRAIGYFNMTLAELNQVATTPAPSPNDTAIFRYISPTAPTIAPNGLIGFEGSALSHLTGAVDDDGRSIGWTLERYNGTPVLANLESVASLAARITADVVAHAARLGNADTFDVAFLLDDSGSFGGSTERASQTFLAVVDAFLSEGRDIFVGMARYSDYAYRTLDNGGAEERPFILQYPLAPVAGDADRAVLVDILNFGALPGNGGGDTPETQWEGLYQLASGAGLDANHNGSTEDSHPAGQMGPTDIPSSFLTPAELAAYQDYAASDNGLGWVWPGYSGDVPAFSSASPSRLTVVSGPKNTRVSMEGRAS